MSELYWLWVDGTGKPWPGALGRPDPWDDMMYAAEDDFRHIFPRSRSYLIATVMM